ncbi:hypothetical protein Ddc_08005 [Ditylenchus destructor]|nr:hypothetical protein Ddc_08005 [Ditylenchus destructor]
MWSSQAFRDGCSLLEQQNAATTPLVPTGGGGGVGRWGQRSPGMASMPTRNRHIQQFASGFSYRKKSQSDKTPTLSVFFSNSRYLKKVSKGYGFISSVQIF